MHMQTHTQALKLSLFILLVKMYLADNLNLCIFIHCQPNVCTIIKMMI